jgi:hypothetical protein
MFRDCGCSCAVLSAKSVEGGSFAHWARAWGLEEVVRDVRDVWPYLDGVDGYGQLDVLVVLWKLGLRAVCQWGRRGESLGAYLARKREEVDCNWATAASCQYLCWKPCRKEAWELIGIG